MKDVNFIVAELGDNDFGHTIMDGLHEGVTVWGHHGKLCPILWKKYLINYVIAYCMVKHFDDDEYVARLTSTKKYLEDLLRVTFEDKAPTDIDECGNACINVHTNDAWTY